MKNIIKLEKNKLPLTFKFIQEFGINKTKEKNNIAVNYIKCEVCQTNYLMREEPIKALTRLL